MSTFVHVFYLAFTEHFYSSSIDSFHVTFLEVKTQASWQDFRVNAPALSESLLSFVFDISSSETTEEIKQVGGFPICNSSQEWCYGYSM